MMVSYVQLEWWPVLVRLPLVAVKRLVLHVKVIKVAIVPGFHLFPFRTEKLSPAAPMVLRNSGRVGSCRFLRVKNPLLSQLKRGFLFSFVANKKYIFAVLIGITGIVLDLINYL